MCDVAKELDNAANSVSNALGTDGSKNGLLNDPISMAALAVGTGMYYAPAGTFGAVADTVTTAAGTAASAAGSAASFIADAVPWSAIGSGAVDIAKAAVPVFLNSRGQPVQGAYSAGYPVRGGYQPDGSFISVSPNGKAAAYGQPVNSYNTAPAAGGSMTLILLALAAFLVLKK